MALMLAMSLVAMDTTILATAVPQVVGDLGGFEQVGWMFSIYLLAQTVTIPIYGKLADVHGRKPILLIGVIIFLAGSALSAAAWDMAALIAFRALQGMSGDRGRFGGVFDHRARVDVVPLCQARYRHVDVGGRFGHLGRGDRAQCADEQHRQGLADPCRTPAAWRRSAMSTSVAGNTFT